MLSTSGSLKISNYSKLEKPLPRFFPQIYTRSFAQVSVDVSSMMEQLKNPSFNINSSFFSPFGCITYYCNNSIYS